jgi:hypothetical protein
MSAILAVGVDIGSQKTMMSKDDADIVRTDTGMLKSATKLHLFQFLIVKIE